MRPRLSDDRFQQLVDEFVELLTARCGLPEEFVHDEVIDFCKALKACDPMNLRTVLASGGAQ